METKYTNPAYGLYIDPSLKSSNVSSYTPSTPLYQRSFKDLNASKFPPSTPNTSGIQSSTPSKLPPSTPNTPNAYKFQPSTPNASKFPPKFSKNAQTYTLVPGLFNPLSGTDKSTFQLAYPTWYDGFDISRVSTIGDGDCFFHAVLKALSAPYRSLSTVEERHKMSRNLRLELAQEADKNYEFYDAKMHYSSTGWPKSKLVQHLMSTDWVGDEVIAIVSKVSKVSIHVVRLVEKYGYLPVISMCTEHNRNIVIVQVKNHYELLVRKTDEGYQAEFDDSDKFITGLKKIYPG